MKKLVFSAVVTAAGALVHVGARAGSSETFIANRAYTEVTSGNTTVAKCPPSSDPACKITVYFNNYHVPVGIDIGPANRTVVNPQPYVSGATSGQEVAARVEADLANMQVGVIVH